MARVQVELPPHFPFTTDMAVYFSHINVGNHLDNVQLLHFVAEGRMRLLHQLGYKGVDVEGCSLIVSDLVTQYVTEGFYGETLSVRMGAADFNRYGFDLVFQIAEKTTNREIARGKVGMVFVARATRKVTPIPDVFRERLRQLCGDSY
jgi:acyl-CoA thioesterase FadM